MIFFFWLKFSFILQELKESFNYGLFSPPENGRAGKFLDEERRLGDYPFNGPVGYLEVGNLIYNSISVCSLLDVRNDDLLFSREYSFCIMVKPRISHKIIHSHFENQAVIISSRL